MATHHFIRHFIIIVQYRYTVIQAHVSHVGRFAPPPARLHCPTRNPGGRGGRGSLTGVPERGDVGGGRAKQSGGGTVDVKLRQTARHQRSLVSGQKQVGGPDSCILA